MQRECHIGGSVALVGEASERIAALQLQLVAVRDLAQDAYDCVADTPQAVVGPPKEHWQRAKQLARLAQQRLIRRRLYQVCCSSDTQGTRGHWQTAASADLQDALGVKHRIHALRQNLRVRPDGVDGIAGSCKHLWHGVLHGRLRPRRGAAAACQTGCKRGNAWRLHGCAARELAHGSDDGLRRVAVVQRC
jgi:hypothetical protein